jgi:hypothetical protein
MAEADRAEIGGPMGGFMDLKAAFVSMIVALAVAQAGALAQSVPPGRVTVPPNKPLASPGLLSDLEYNETYLGLRSFWSDDLISQFFENAAEGTLHRVRPLVAELCDKWQHRDPHLPVTGIISVPPGTQLDLNQLCR